MYEKTSPFHPDKLADRVAGALVDYCYAQQRDPRCAFEVLTGHGQTTITGEASVTVPYEQAVAIVERIVGRQERITLNVVPQDSHLADNQRESEASTATHFRCGDNGIFRGMPVTQEQKELTALMHTLAHRFPTDAKAVLTPSRLIVCQSQATANDVFQTISEFVRANGYGNTITGRMTPPQILITPLGPWDGGATVDAGATNRKLGSDMGDSVTGGGLMGKDLSKADVSVNIVAFLLAQRHQQPVTAACAIGDEEVTFCIGSRCTVNGERLEGETMNPALGSAASLVEEPLTMNYHDIVEQARLYILTLGGFEKFAEWGLIRHRDE